MPMMTKQQPFLHTQHHHVACHTQMEFLKAEIAQKRKALQEETSNAPRPNKYMRRGELEKLKEEQERKEREAKEREREEAKTKEVGCICSTRIKIDLNIIKSEKKAQSSSRASGSPAPGGVSTPTTSELTFNISNGDAIRRLRSKGQPIRLFGESDKERRLRLRALELIEGRDTNKGAGLNDFKKVMEGMEVGLDLAEVEKKLLDADGKEKGKESDGKEKGKAKEEEGVGLLDLELVKTDPDKLYPIIYYALKKVLKEWEQSMDERPGEFKIPACMLALLTFSNRPNQALYARKESCCRSGSVCRVS